MPDDLSKHLCEFKADPGQECEECRSDIPEGGEVYFFSDGGFEPRDGTYVCRSCAVMWMHDKDKVT